MIEALWKSFRLRLFIRLRKIGISMPWTLAEVEQEWFGGHPILWDADNVGDAFNWAQRIAGCRWVLGTEIDLAMFGGLPGIGRRGGYSEFLRVYWFGSRVASMTDASGADDLTRKVLSGDHSASEEATAIHLLRHRHRDTDLEVAPPIVIGSSTRHPDFRIRKNGNNWMYVEVTQLHRSDASTRVATLLARVSERVMNIERPFLLEIILNREPADAEVESLVAAARSECDAPIGVNREVGDIGHIIVKSGDPSVVIPSVETGDSIPRMAISRSLIGPGAENRQILVRIPFEDQRAEDILRDKARQLPKGECGLVMVNVNAQPSAFESWSKRIPERFGAKLHTRVAGVILFMHATQPTSQGLAWLAHVKLIPNPHAVIPLPVWVTEEIDRVRAETRSAERA